MYIPSGCVCSCVRTDKNRAEEDYFFYAFVSQIALIFPLSVLAPVCGNVFLTLPFKIKRF
jgi:hypothetical protein